MEFKVGPGSGECDAVMRPYIDALSHLEDIRDKIPEEIENAPGRLLDRFQFLPVNITKILPAAPEDTAAVLEDKSKEAVDIIELVRTEMDQRGTKNVLKYIAQNPKKDLGDKLTEMQSFLFRIGMDATSDCICSRVCSTK